MIGIISAMAVENERIKEMMTEKKSTVRAGVEFVSGKLCEKEVVVAVCGIGKVFAAICTQMMIDLFSPDAIINTGVAGALSDGLAICDIVAASALVQHDMDTSALGDPIGLVSGINKVYFESDAELTRKLKESALRIGAHCVDGVVATGDLFVADGEKKRDISEKFSALACEMEGCAIAQCAYVNRVPFAVLRAISDGANSDSVSDYPTFVGIASGILSKVIFEFMSI